MDPRRLHRGAAFAALGLALLLLVDLFLGWQEVRVDVAGVVRTTETASGWGPYGLVAGALAIALVLVELETLRHAAEDPGRRELGAVALALGIFVAVTVQALTGDVSVTVAAIGVEVESTQWPAIAGIALSLALVAATLVPLVGSVRAPRGAMPHGTA
ncbi:MAG TPA: hypothetical protein VK874_12960 [Gaiellaceae bacterium]|nr:hypothetical protein [Gaiellaceae bacterium]